VPLWIEKSEWIAKMDSKRGSSPSNAPIPARVSSPIFVVQKWHEALNASQVEEMVALLHPQVEVGGPQGTTRGARSVREWLVRSKVRLLPQRWFDGGNQIVVQEIGEWRSAEGDQETTGKLVATVFRVDENGLITRIWRQEALAPALEEVCLSFEDEVELD